MERRTILNDDRQVTTKTQINYVKDGVVYTGAIQDTVMVESEDDLEGLADFPVGTVAFTAGFGGMWQLAADGTWADMLEA